MVLCHFQRELIRNNMAQLSNELLDVKDDLAAAEARCASFESMEDDNSRRMRHTEQRVSLTKKAIDLVDSKSNLFCVQLL